MTFSLNFEEQAELFAHLLYWGEQIVQEEEYREYRYDFMRDVAYYWGDSFGPEFERKNYYNLKNFKEMWEKAKEEGNGVIKKPTDIG
jgi:hypothetical protein